jgi:uncharacterized protein
MDLEFEWDGDKRLANIEKHGIDFRAAKLLFDGRPVFTTESGFAGEPRILTTGMIGGKLYTAIWTQREAKVRFISVRRARDAEERAYRSIHGPGNR